MSTSGDIIMNVGDTMCTSGDVQYIGEIPLVHWGGGGVHWGMFSTSERYHDAFGGAT